MKHVLIIYKILSDIDQDHLQKIINGCKSKKHNVTINLYDFTLSKKIKSQIQNIEFSDLVSINVSDENYEDIEKSDQVIVQKLIAYSHFDIVSILVHDVLLDNTIDQIDFSILEDDDVASIYPDSNICTPFNTRVYGRSHPLMNVGIRCLFVNMSKLLSVLGNENPIGAIYNHYPSCHFPEALFTTNALENE